MLTALLRWINKSRKDQRKTLSKTSRPRQSPEELFRFACDTFVPHSLRNLWQGEIPSRTLFLEAFEDRLLFSAAPALAPAPVEVVVVAPSLAVASAPEESPTTIPETDTDGATTETVGILASPPSTSDSERAAAATLVVIDPSVPEYESLLDQLMQQQSGPLEVLVLDSQRDGLEQIAERLEQLGQTRAIHILSHGDESGLHLGSNWLSADTISMRSNTLVQWQPMLTADADVLFYGCDLAANSTGQEFLRTFGQLTGANVGASTDATGAAILGGDWDLEFQYGSLQTRSLGESMNLFDWDGLLTTNTYQQGVSSYTGTQDTTINSSTPGTGDGASTTVTIGGASAKAGLIRFDSLFGSGPGQIPVGSTIHSASLRVNVTTGTATESTITLHRVLANWSGASTWNTLGSGLSRDDVEVATVADSLVTGTTSTGFQTITGLEESLQAWSDGEANNGWALFGDNTSPWTFASSEGATSAQRPMLIIDFTPPTAAPVGELLATGETRVNVTTTNSQSTATNGRNSHDAVGVDANGNYVVVWTSDLADGSGAGVYGQRFNSRGLAQGGQFQINQTTADNQQWASVAMKSDGGFIVTWTSQNQDGGGQGVYARIYTATGVGGTEFLVNTTTAGTQHASTIGVAADGSFVIAWEGNGTGDTAGIFAQQFDAGGGKQNGEIRVNTTTANTQYDPAIAVGQDGQFMIVWDDSIGTSGRRFNVNGTARDASQITLHSDVTSGNADVATNGTGDYHIVWRTTGGGDGSGRAIWRMSLASSDNAATALVQVPANSINDQTEPAITSNGEGDFIVTWQGAGPGDTAGAFARKFLSDGTAVGTEFQLNETVSGSQIAVSAAIVDLNNFITVWSGNGAGDSDGVFARTYGTQKTDDSLLFTTWGDENSSGVPGLESWTYEDILSLGDPNLTLGTNASGTLSIAGSVSAYGDGNVFLESLDLVQRDVLVGSAGNTVQLLAGDYLFSVWGNETLGSLSVQGDDVVVFRPDLVGVFASGSFFILFDGMESMDGGQIQYLADLDLIEQNTLIGDVLLQPGDLVVADSGNSSTTLHVFHATGVGAGTTTGSVTTLFIDSEINLSKEIVGAQVIERDFVIGGVQLREGNLLVTVNRDSTLGTNSLPVTKHDVAVFSVITTSLNGPASVTASMLLTGSELSLDSGAEAIQTLALQSASGTPPTVNDDTYHLTEDETFDSSNLWYDANWSSRIELTFNNASRAENLDDFPILVTLDTNRFDYSLAKANGADLRFVDAHGQLLSHEIETWNPSGISAIWVKVPRIDASSSTDSIHLYYGNAAAADIQNSAAVWSNGYVGVWHLNGDPSGTQTIADATSSNQDGTSIGMDGTNQVSGPIGGALKFDGSSEAIRIESTGTDPLAIAGSHLTVEAWVNSTGSTGDWETILNRRNIVISPIQSYGLKTALIDQSQVVHTTGTPDLTGVAGSLPDDQWKYLTGVLSGSTSNLYINGIQNATGTAISFGSGDEDVTIGAAEAGVDSVLSQYWKGGIDEVRLSNVARSAAWTAAQYASMTDTLITYGERQTVAGLLDNDQSATTGGLVVSSVDLSNLTGGATAMLLDDGRVRFIPGTGFQDVADGQSVSQQITYTAMDSNGNTNIATATFVIHGVNDAPLINTLVGPLTLTSVDEGTTNPAGNTVLEILTSAAGTLITDVDSGAVQGIAVTSIDTTHGTWEYSIDGTTWLSLTGVSTTNATLLDTSSHVRFIPTAGFSGAAGAMTFRAWDRTTGTNTQTGVNVSTNGGLTAFSAQTTMASIAVTSLNTAPVVVTNLGMTASEGGTVLLSSTRLAASDAENTPAQLTYTLSTSPTQGRLERVAAPGVAITTFTQADITSSAIRYVHNGGETTSDSFSFSLSDGTASVTGSFAITITPVNDAPVITTNATLTATEGGTASLSSGYLNSTDVETGPAGLTYSVTGGMGFGHLALASAPEISITSFTQAQINSNQIVYVHDGAESTTDYFTFSVSDGALAATGTMSITITADNDAPEFAASRMTLNEGQTLTLSSDNLLTNDTDTPTTSLLYTVNSVTSGRFESTSALGIAITSFSQDDVTNSRVLFVHNGSEAAPTATLTVTDGVSAVGPNTMLMTFSNVNDPLAITANTGMTLNEGATATIGSIRLATSDPDNPPAQRVFTITTPPTHGRIEKSTNAGVAITSFTQADINDVTIRYVHDGSDTTSDGFGFLVTDGVTTVNGTFGISITAVNDPPTLTASAITVSEGQSVTLTLVDIDASDADSGNLTFSVSALSRGQFKDTTTGQSVASFTRAQVQAGQIRFGHDGNENGPSATVSVSDGVSSTTPVTIAFTFSRVNDPPIALADTITTPITSEIVLSPSILLANDSDAEHDTLTISITRQPDHGTLVTNLDGTYTYRPDLSYPGRDSFEYVVSDGTASSAPAVVSLDISVIGPGTSNSSDSTSSNSTSSSTDSGTADGSSGTTGQTSSGTPSSTTSGSLTASSTGGSLSGTNSSSSETEGYAFISNTHDEVGIGLFLVRQGQNTEEVSQRVRTPQGLDAIRSNSRSAEVALRSVDNLMTGTHWAQLNDHTSNPLSQFRTILASDANLNAFADVTKSLQSDLTNELIFEIPALAGASLTVGYVVWMLRGGLLITSLLAQVPAWSIVDPLAVLDSLDKSDEDDESIGSLLEQGQSELEPVM